MHTHKISSILTLGTIIIAPILIGSYFNLWRWPAIILATCAILSLPLTYTTRKHPSIHNKTTLLPPLCTLTLITLGAWMWYNAWGSFSRDLFTHGVRIPWLITSIENQPHPSLPGSPDKTETLDRLTYIFPCLLLLLTTKSLISRNLLQTKHLSLAIFGTGSAIALLGITQRFTEAEAIFWSFELPQKHHRLFFGTYRSPGIATCYLNICLSLGLSHLLAVTRTLQKSNKANPTKPIFISLGIITILASSIMAGSKAGAILALATITLWATFNFRSILHILKRSSNLLPSGSPHERNILITTILIATTLSTLSIGNTVYKRWEAAKSSNFNTLNLRNTANNIQIEMIESDEWDKLTGFGPGSFYPLFHYYKGEQIPGSVLVYAHNDHLQTLVEWGYLGTGCFVILIGGGGTVILFEQFARRKRHRTSQIFYFRGMTIAMVICLVHATVDFPFQIESIAMTFSVILGAAWATPSLRVSNKSKTKSKKRRTPEPQNT